MGESGPVTRFAPARGGRLAYQVFGRGEHTVVAIPPTAQNIEMSWEQPTVKAMLDRFGSFCRYLHFDKRGTGCSDRRGRIADLDERVDDLRAIMDHAGIDHAFLSGNSEGGPMTLLFAATYPERVDGMILFGTGPSLLPPDTTEEDREQRRPGMAAYAARWGTDDSPCAPGMAPTLAAQDPTFVPWHRRYERYAASQDSLLELLELSLYADVRELAPSIDIPALVIHRTDDRVIPVERGRELADLLPNAELFEQPGEDHFSYSGDVDGWMDRFERFVTGEVRSGPTTRPLRPTVRITTLGRFTVEVDGAEVPVSDWGSRRARQLRKRPVAARGWPVTRDELFDLLWPDEVVATYAGTFLPEDVYEGWTEGARTEARSRFVLAARNETRRALDDAAHDRAVELAHRLLEVDRYDEEAHRLLVAALTMAGAVGEATRAREAFVAAMTELGLPTSEREGSG